MILRLLVFFYLLSLPILGFCGDYIDLPASKFELRGERIYENIDGIMENPESMLKRYVPVGVKIKNKIISRNQIQFMATKTFIGISKTVFYMGSLDINYVKSEQGQKCFQAIHDFTGSDGLIIDNVESLIMTICSTEITKKHLSVVAKPRIIKGKFYGGMLSTLAKNMIADQVEPILSAVRQEIEQK